MKGNSMKSKKKTSKKKTKSKNKKKIVKKNKKSEVGQQLIAGLQEIAGDLNIYSKPKNSSLNEKDSFGFYTESCGCKQPETGCLDEKNIHQDGICEDSECRNEICRMERSLKEWEVHRNPQQDFVIKQEDLHKPFWNDPTKSSDPTFWQKFKQFFGFRSRS
jgi:hypothetical protein